MKKLFFSVILFCGIGLNSIAQVNFGADNYPNVGDEFPLIKYLTNPGDDTVMFSEFISGDDMAFNTIESFTEYVIDTVKFLNPADYDADVNFGNATHLMRDGERDTYIIKDSESAQSVGFTDDQFYIGFTFPVALNDPLILMKFPTDSETSYTDMSYGERAMHISMLENVIPVEYFDTVSSSFDSVKFVMSVKNSCEILETQTVSIDLGSVGNHSFTCLKEYQEIITESDVFVRSILFNVWVPLSNIPGAQDMLPMDLPYIDSTYNMNWWTPEYSIPLVQMNISQNMDSVYSVRFHYNGQSSLGQFFNESFDVFPNPATDFVTLKLNDRLRTAKYVEVVNLAGIIVEQFSINGKFFNFATERLVNGIYFIRIMDEKRTVLGSQKMLINKN